MRNFEERKAEVFRRSENRIKERKRIRNRILAVCIPLCLSLTISSFMMLGIGGAKHEALVDSDDWIESEIWGYEEFDNNSSVSDENDDNVQSSTSSNKPQSSAFVNFKGKTITVAGWGNGAGPHQSSLTYKKELELVSSIEKKYNCKIQWKTTEDAIEYYKNFVTAAMAGTGFADIVKLPGNQTFPNAIAGGYVWQLDGFMKDFDNVIMWDPVVDNQLKINNRHYFLAPVTHKLDSGLFFNPDVFEKLEVEKTPHDYMDEGDWTWANFLQLAKDCTKTVDDVNYYGFADFDCRAFIKSNGGVWWKTNDNGTQSFNLQDPLCIEGIQFVYDLYNVHKVMPESDGEKLFKEGFVAMDCAAADNYFYSDFKFAEVPIGPNAKDYINNNIDIDLWAIPKTVKASEVGALLNILRDYVNPTYKWREEMEEVIGNYFNDEKSAGAAVAHIKRSLNSEKYWNTYYPFAAQNIFGTDFGIKTQTAPAEFIQYVQAEAEAEIDNIWKNTLLAAAKCEHIKTTLLNYKKPTCIEQGYSGDSCCSVCGEIVSSGQVLTKVAHSSANNDHLCDACNARIRADGQICNHNRSKIRSRKEATCTEEGYTGDKVCIDCELLLQKGSVIAKIYHGIAQEPESSVPVSSISQHKPIASEEQEMIIEEAPETMVVEKDYSSLLPYAIGLSIASIIVALSAIVFICILYKR